MRRPAFFAKTASLLILSIGFALLSARADTLPVTDAASFVSALGDAFNNPTRSDVVNISPGATIDLSSVAQRAILPLYKTGGATLVIEGTNATINCGGLCRPFFILAGNVTIRNLTIPERPRTRRRRRSAGKQCRRRRRRRAGRRWSGVCQRSRRSHLA